VLCGQGEGQQPSAQPMLHATQTQTKVSQHTTHKTNQTTEPTTGNWRTEPKQQRREQQNYTQREEQQEVFGMHN